MSSRQYMRPLSLTSMPCMEVGGNTTASPAPTAKRAPSQKASPSPAHASAGVWGSDQPCHVVRASLALSLATLEIVQNDVPNLTMLERLLACRNVGGWRSAWCNACMDRNHVHHRRSGGGGGALPARMKKSSWEEGCVCGVVRCPASKISTPKVKGTCHPRMQAQPPLGLTPSHILPRATGIYSKFSDMG